MRIFRNFNFQFAQFFFCDKFRPHAISKSTPDILQNTPALKEKNLPPEEDEKNVDKILHPVCKFLGHFFIDLPPTFSHT